MLFFTNAFSVSLSLISRVGANRRPLPDLLCCLFSTPVLTYLLINQTWNSPATLLLLPERCFLCVTSVSDSHDLLHHLFTFLADLMPINRYTWRTQRWMADNRYANLVVLPNMLKVPLFSATLQTLHISTKAVKMRLPHPLDPDHTCDGPLKNTFVSGILIWRLSAEFST